MAGRIPMSVLRIDQITGQMTAAGLALATAAFATYTATRRTIKPVYCEMCGGKGHWDCVICGATGFIKKEIEGSSVRGRRIRKKCVACVGRGKRLCKKCGATGIKAI